jgi:hypothetical protein
VNRMPRHTIPLAAACFASVAAATTCIDPIDDVLIQYMGDVDVEGALSDSLGSLFITSKASHIVEVRLTWQALADSGISGLFPAQTSSFDVWVYNSNRVTPEQSSIYTVDQTQGRVLIEPGGPGDIVVMVVDGAGFGVGSGGTIDICDPDDGGGCTNPLDANCDGVLDLDDIIAIIECVLSGGADCDCNDDGVTDLHDLQACIDGFDDDDDPPCP